MKSYSLLNGCQKQKLQLNFDVVWGNIIKKIEGGEWNNDLTLEENIEIKEKQEKEIERLEKLARKEV